MGSRIRVVEFGARQCAFEKWSRHQRFHQRVLLFDTIARMTTF